MNTDAFLYDCHTHVLPEMDDGSKDAETSLEMLMESASQGVFGVIATPHYYSQESIEDFLKRRQKAFDSLKAVFPEGDWMYLCMGAEVAYRQNISRREHFADLRLGGSEYMLIEMPFRKWSRCEVAELKDMISVLGIIPVIAHIERYMDFQDKKTLQELFSLPVLIQSNAEFFLNRKTRRAALKMAKEGNIQIISSDMHSAGEGRVQNLGEVQGLKIPDEIFQNTQDLFFAAYESAPEEQKL